MTDWWRSLNARERLLVSFAAIFLLGACLFLFALEPLAKEQQAIQHRVQTEREALARVKRYANEARILRQQSADTAEQTVDKSQSFLSILNRTSSVHQLQQHVKRIVPNGVDKASVVFDKVPFDRLTAWLIDLQVKHAVTVALITVDKTKDSGLVRANVNLVR